MPYVLCYAGYKILPYQLLWQGKKYAIGLSLVAASGKISSNYIDMNGLNVTERVQSHFVGGGMLQNSLNINAGKSLCIGVELGLGSSLTDRVGGVTQSTNEFLIQGSVKIGYRF